MGYVPGLAVDVPILQAVGALREHNIIVITVAAGCPCGGEPVQLCGLVQLTAQLIPFQRSNSTPDFNTERSREGRDTRDAGRAVRSPLTPSCKLNPAAQKIEPGGLGQTKETWRASYRCRCRGEREKDLQPLKGRCADQRQRETAVRRSFSAPNKFPWVRRAVFCGKTFLVHP